MYKKIKSQKNLHFWNLCNNNELYMNYYHLDVSLYLGDRWNTKSSQKRLQMGTMAMEK